LIINTKFIIICIFCYNWKWCRYRMNSLSTISKYTKS